MILPYLVHFNEANPDERFLVAHFQEGKVMFMQETLKTTMQKYGINIPPGKRSDYENKTIVYLNEEGDNLFEKAFRDVYFKLHMPKNEYKWVRTFSVISSSQSL